MSRAAVVAALVVLGACSPGVQQQETSDGTTRPTFASTSTTPPTFAPVTERDDEPAASTTVPPASGTSTPPVPPAAGGSLAERITSLTVAPEADADTYSRDLFGGDWIDADGDGCDTRCEVLEMERRTDLPGLPGGGWLSAFDGYSTDDPSELDIDHLVPLAEAWRSGASTWTASRRIAFANDLDNPGSLIGVTAATNRSKGDRDPATWQPPNTDAWCQYVTDWVDTKLTWSLTADEAEIRAVTNMASSRRC